MVIFNSNVAGSGCETLVSMTFAGYTGTARSIFVSRNIGMRMIGAYDPSSYRCTMNDPALTTPTPPAPSEGIPLRAGFHFDGWGYMHLYRNTGDQPRSRSTTSRSRRGSTSATRAASAT